MKRCLYQFVKMAIVLMLVGCSARPSDVSSLCSSASTPFQLTTQKADDLHDIALDLLQKAQVGIPVEGHHAIETHSTASQNHIAQRWHKRLQRQFCMVFTQSLNHRYKHACSIHLHYSTLRYTHGDAIYGRCQMRC